MALDQWNGRWRGLAPQGDSHHRARQIVGPSGALIRGKFPSRKNGRMVQHEGLLELDAIYLFESSPEIIRYREQPRTIRYPDGNKLRRYTPDFEIYLVSGEVVLIEVKPSSKLLKPDIIRKLMAVKAHLARSGERFVVLTEESIRLEPRLSGLKWVYHQAARIPPERTRAYLALLKHRHEFPATLRSASAFLATELVDPFSLLLNGLLQVSLASPLSLETEILMREEGGHEWFFISQEHGF